MLYNPISNQLFTNDGTFLRQLHCPLQKQWDDLGEAISLKGKMCNDCQKVVIDSSRLNESDLIQHLKDDPHTCIKIDLNQQNIYLTHQTHEQSR